MEFVRGVRERGRIPNIATDEAIIRPTVVEGVVRRPPPRDDWLWGWLWGVLGDWIGGRWRRLLDVVRVPLPR